MATRLVNISFLRPDSSAGVWEYSRIRLKAVVNIQALRVTWWSCAFDVLISSGLHTYSMRFIWDLSLLLTSISITYTDPRVFRKWKVSSSIWRFIFVDKKDCVGLPDSSRLGCDILVTCAGHYIITATVCRAIMELKIVEDVPWPSEVFITLIS